MERSAELFTTIKKETNGYLKPEVYHEIYRSARIAPAGSVIDIGPAQGGSTISLGLGRKDGGHEIRIYSLDVFRGKKKAMFHGFDTDKNVDLLYRNVARYDLLDHVRAIPVGDVNPRSIVPSDEDVGIIFIDADGALDRDFRMFYRQLVGGAIVILDDVKNMINRHANEKFLKFSRQEEAEFARSRGVASMRDLVPLGKEYTTWRFTTLLVEHGLIVPFKELGATQFFTKPDGPDANRIFDRMEGEFDRVRDEIYAEYLQRRETA